MIKINSKLKDEFQRFCKGMGMSSSAVIMLLVRKCVSERSLPFELILPDHPPNLPIGTNEAMYWDQDDKMSIRIDGDLKARFRKVCDEDLNMLMSVLVKAFMVQCIAKGRLPFSPGVGGETNQTRP